MIMQLWNDYEGKTIADVYPLGPLLRPEGRSALFALAGGADAPAIIRLTEALNDEGEMLACWRLVTEVKQENLLKIKRFGQTNFEGTPLAYAVMEVTDANLADLLKERPLTHPEAMQVATSVAAALTALHARNLVHEHIDAGNILAAGETVKLRTDCVREFIVDDVHPASELREVVERDVQDFARMLLHALTLEKRLSPTTRLAAPFDKIIPNALNGSWGLPEITEALTPAAATPLVPASVTKPSVTKPAASAAGAAASAARPPQAEPVAGTESSAAEPLLRWDPRRSDDDAPPPRQKVLLWSGAAAILILLITLCVHAFSGKKTAAPPVATQPAVASPAQSSAPAQAAAAGAAANLAANEPAPAAPASAGPGGKVAVTAHMQPGWYVIAYTYNHEDQAWKRVAEIMKRHPSLNPQVIAPSGHTPFLISLGGAMSRSEAEAARNRARRQGMPRDTFIRNYQGTQS
jgi:hypothetical protein